MAYNGYQQGSHGESNYGTTHRKMENLYLVKRREPVVELSTDFGEMLAREFSGTKVDFSHKAEQPTGEKVDPAPFRSLHEFWA